MCHFSDQWLNLLGIQLYYMYFIWKIQFGKINLVVADMAALDVG